MPRPWLSPELKGSVAVNSVFPIPTNMQKIMDNTKDEKPPTIPYRGSIIVNRTIEIKTTGNIKYAQCFKFLLRKAI